MFGWLKKKNTPAVAAPAAPVEEKVNVPSVEPACTVISFAGVRRGDMIYYLSKLLSTCDAPVLVVDNSTIHDMFRSVQHENEKVAYYKNVTVIANAAYNARFKDIFRYIIVYHEFNISKAWWDNSDYCYMITDFDRYNMQRVVNLFGTIHRDAVNKVMTLIITGRYNGSFSDKFLAESLMITSEFLDEAIEIPQDDDTMVKWLSFQNNGIAKPDKLSKDYQKMLWAIYQKVTPVNNKNKMSSVFNKTN